MKDYLIHRNLNGSVTVTVVTLKEDGGNAPAPTYLLPHLEKHSPDGFEYGYMGSGPSDLARSIVGDWSGTDDPDPRVYQQLKKIAIAQFDRDKDFHVIAGEQVANIVRLFQ